MPTTVVRSPAHDRRRNGKAPLPTTVNYPFTAIVGQEEMKLCLLLNVIDPRIGGVMILSLIHISEPTRH